MIDKLDFAVPHNIPFSRAAVESGIAGVIDRQIQINQNPYGTVLDLRSFKISATLRYRPPYHRERHKLEIHRVGQKNAYEIDRMVRRVFDVDAFDLPLARVDFTADVPGIPVRWFRWHAFVTHKRTDTVYHARVESDARVETLYFGKGKDFVRIYDKIAEIESRNELPLTFAGPWTRVERQVTGDRLHTLATTFGELLVHAESLRPFDRVRFTHGGPLPSREGWDPLKYMTGIGIRQAIEQDGLSATRQFLSDDDVQADYA